MKQATQSSFNEGLLMDLNPLVTPQTCLTDCLNGTLITYNGNEFTLQNDMGNVKIEHAKIPLGFVPLGVKEYGGILYLALYNPVDNLCEIGSIPSPDYNVNPNKAGDGIIKVNSSSLISSNSDGSFKFKDLFLKLFEFEQLELNPGDEYVLGYSVNSVNGVDIFNNTKNPLYSVNLYAVDKDNKQHLLEDLNVIKMENSSKEPDEFKYFNHTISSILALNITINQIDWFDAIIYESTDGVNIQLYGKNRLNQEGNTDDDLYVRGCKIDYEYVRDGENVKKTTYLNGGEPSESFRELFTLKNSNSGLEEGDVVNFEITPFDQYHFIEDLKRRLTITMGERYNPNANANIFKYKYSRSNKSMRLDFSLPTLGMVNPYMYVEMYDVWSGYSIIFPIEDINPAGMNTLFIDVINEPLVNIYDSSDIGGTPSSVLKEYIKSEQSDTSKIYFPFLSNSTKGNKIRKQQVIRENNLYVVKMSAIDMNEKNTDSLNISDYTNIYKLLTVNSNYNDLYDQVKESGQTSDVDFNNYNLNKNMSVSFEKSLSNAKYEDLKKEDSNISVKTNIDGKTYYYKILNPDNNEFPIDGSYESLKINSTRTMSQSISMFLSSVNNCFGSVSLEDYNMSLLNNNLTIKDEDIVDSKFDTSLSSNNLKIVLETNRELSARITKETKNITIVAKKVTIEDEMYKRKISEDRVIIESIKHPALYLGGHGNYDYPRKIHDYNTREELTDNDPINSDALKYVLNKVEKSGAILSFVGSIGDDDIDLTENGPKTPSYFFQNPWVPVFRTFSSAVAIVYENKNKVIEILKDLYYPVMEMATKDLYYYTNVSSNDKSLTELSGNVTLSVSSILKTSQNINNYGEVSNFTNTSQFISNIGLLLKSRGVSDYNIDETNYIQLEPVVIDSEIEIPVSNLSISSGIPTSVRDKIINSNFELLENNPEIANPSEVTNKVLSESNMYSNFTDKFTAEYSEDEDRVKFIYVPNSIISTTQWRDDSWLYPRGVDVETKPFDQP